MIQKNDFEIKREFASFGGKCQYRCNHCYTFISDFNSCNKNTIADIIKKLDNRDFNFLYVSGYNENFILPSTGINLLEELYIHYKCHILFTTRNIFNEENINRLKKLNDMMLINGHRLYACVSISAYNSYKKLEPNERIPTPQKRIEFVKNLYRNKIKTFLTLRPICPNSYIPTSEYCTILEKVGNNCTGVISSGIVVNKEILKQLVDFPKSYSYQKKPIMKCLEQNNLFVEYVNVDNELQTIRKKCKECGVHFYSESIPAIKDNF